jgi:hypothetical protein
MCQIPRCSLLTEYPAVALSVASEYVRVHCVSVGSEGMCSV